jgi:hypothetical protein
MPAAFEIPVEPRFHEVQQHQDNEQSVYTDIKHMISAPV